MRSVRGSPPARSVSALVILIMLVYYRFSGFLAVVGLLFYGLTTLGILAGFDADAHAPGPRRFRVVDRHGRRRELPDLRAHS